MGGDSGGDGCGAAPSHGTGVGWGSPLCSLTPVPSPGIVFRASVLFGSSGFLLRAGLPRTSAWGHAAALGGGLWQHRSAFASTLSSQRGWQDRASAHPAVGQPS